MTVCRTIAPDLVLKPPDGYVRHTPAIFTYDYLLGWPKAEKGCLCQSG
jgi:hypothetical protein